MNKKLAITQRLIVSAINYQSYRYYKLKIFTIFLFMYLGLLGHTYAQPLAGTDELGRILPQSTAVGTPNSGKTVAMFYFLWMGHSGSPTSITNCDLGNIVAANPGVLTNFTDPNWGSTGSAYYYWGQSIYNYYKGNDYWVHLKNVQLLTDAGVDILVLDATNAIHYGPEANELMNAIDALIAQGKNPPKLVFYTNTSSGATMQNIYNDFYKTGAPYRHPNTWYYMNSKPLIIGITSQSVGKDYASFFTYRESQWPNEAQKTNGWPWIEFVRPQKVYSNSSSQREIVNVSVAQHPNLSAAMGGSAFYGATGNWGRSYRNGSPGNPSVDLPYGYNVQEQWDYAIAQNVPYVFVTGWNEWIVGRWHYSTALDPGQQKSQFVDQASPEYSRDIEPSLTGSLKDNYYMQLVSNVRKYKGVEASTALSASTTISSMANWTSVTPNYSDYTGDVQARNSTGGPSSPAVTYTNTTGRNDFQSLKVARDATNLYFYAKTVATITGSGNDFMNLWLDTDRNATSGWKGYDYRIISSTLQKYVSGAWVNVVVVTKTQSGNELYYTIPRSSLGNLADPLNLEFKWSDNMQGSLDDPMNWYVNGDAAPGARFNFIAMTELPQGILNTGFEYPLTSTFQYGAFTNGWTFDTQSGIQRNASAWGAPTAPQGIQTAFVQRTGVITETVNFTAGSFKVGFFAAKRTGNTQTVEVYYDSTLIGTITPASSTAWTYYTTNAFTATAGAHTIKFVGTQTTDQTAFIDAVDIVLQTTLTNTGFETPVVSGFQYGPLTNGWTFDAGSGPNRNGSAFGAPTAIEGTQNALLQNTGSFYQDFNFTGGSYKVSFYAAQRSGNTQTIRVTCDGVVIGTITPTSSTAFNYYTTNSFTVSAGTHRIMFSGTSAPDNTAFIDKVSLVLATSNNRIGLSTKESEKSDDAISIYPNPATDQITLTNVQINSEVSVFTLEGKKVYSAVQTLKQSPLVIKANSWSKGVYLVHVKTDTDNIIKKIIIQ